MLSSRGIICVKCLRCGLQRFYIVYRQSRLDPVDPSFRALSGRLEFTVRRHKFSTDSLSHPVEYFGFAFLGCGFWGLGCRVYGLGESHPPCEIYIIWTLILFGRVARCRVVTTPLHTCTGLTMGCLAACILPHPAKDYVSGSASIVLTDVDLLQKLTHLYHNLKETTSSLLIWRPG